MSRERETLIEQVKAAGTLAGWMTAAAKRAAEDMGLDLTPGMLTLAALIVAVTEARRGKLSRGQWRLLVWWLRRDLDPSGPSDGD